MLGSILLVAITVVVAVAFAVLMLQFKGPAKVPVSHVATSLGAGSSGWGTGDESLRLTHNGGDPLLASQTKIVYSVNGVTTTLTGTTGPNALGGAFADGKLTVGEVWVRTTSLAATDNVAMAVVYTGSGTSLLAQATLVPGNLPSGQVCIFDVSPPSVSTWVQAPADVNTASVGAVTVTATLADDCFGVSQTATPELWWRINPGTNPAFAQAAAMTLTGTSTWQGTIPSAVWATKTGQTLEYELRAMTDLASPAHTGTSVRQADLVDLFTQYTYVGTATVQPGVLANRAGAPSASDSGAVATITENGITTFAPTTQVSAGVGWTAVATDTQTSNDVYATASGNPGALRLGGYPDPVAAGAITAVKIKVEQSISPFVDDTWTVQACAAGGACGVATVAQAGSLADSVKTFDVTALRPAACAAAWTWACINSIETSIQPVKVASADGTWRVDFVTVEVTFASAQTAVQFDFTGVPAGAVGTRNVQLSYSTALDTFNVQVYDWVAGTWSTPCATLNSAGLTSWTCVLSANQYSAGLGLVRIRFADVAPTTAPVGVLTLEYARVAST